MTLATTLKDAPIVLGGNVFGWTVPETEAFALLDAYVERGGRAIDTADAYSFFVPGNHGGESETILGAWMKARGNRDKVHISTKVAKLPARAGLAPANLRAAVDDSLRRLQTDYIDLYYAHQDDEATPQVDYVAAFDELVRAGKVRTLGASNFSATRLTSAIEIARANNLARFEVSQDEYNLVERDFEVAMQPTLVKEGVTELPFFSLAKGFLTGKYHPGAKVDSARAGGASAYLAKPKNVQLIGVLEEIAAHHGVSVAAISLSWLRAQPTVGAPIASARTIDQLAPLFETVTLSADELARLA